jgi:hypothetical protein
MTTDELAEYDAETVRIVDAAEQRIAEAEANASRLAGEARSAKKFAKEEAAELRRLVRERADNRGKQPAPTLLTGVKGHHTPAGSWREIKIDSLPIGDGIKAHLSFEDVKTAGELHDAITSFAADDGTPFGLPAGDVAEVRMKIAELADYESQMTAAPPDLTDLWREYPISRWTRFGMTAKDVEKLAEGNVKRESGRTPVETVGDLSNFSTPTAGGYSRKYADVKGIGAAGADRISDAETRFWGWWRDGGEEEYARERGLIRGDASDAGTVGFNPIEFGSGEAAGDLDDDREAIAPGDHRYYHTPGAADC